MQNRVSLRVFDLQSCGITSGITAYGQRSRSGEVQHRSLWREIEHNGQGASSVLKNARQQCCKWPLAYLNDVIPLRVHQLKRGYQPMEGVCEPLAERRPFRRVQHPCLWPLGGGPIDCIRIEATEQSPRLEVQLRPAMVFVAGGSTCTLSPFHLASQRRIAWGKGARHGINARFANVVLAIVWGGRFFQSNFIRFDLFHNSLQAKHRAHLKRWL